MSEYSKKLHIKYNNIQTDIKLYTTTSEVGNNYISLYDGIYNTYAKLDTASGTNLHIKKNGTIYNVIKEAIVQHGNKMITSNTTFIVPSGVTQLTVTASAGGGGGTGCVWIY